MNASLSSAVSNAIGNASNAAGQTAVTNAQDTLSRAMIQQDLRRTQFYKGRADGQTGDEDAMTRAIKLVQLSANLPVTGVYDAAVHHAIDNYVATAPTGHPQWTDPPPAPPAPSTAPAPVTATQAMGDAPVSPAGQPARSPLAALLGLSLLTSPLWIPLLVLPAWKARR